MKRIILILLVAGLWHSPVSAEDFYWRGIFNGVEGIGSTPDAAAAIIYSSFNNLRADGACAYEGISGGQPYFFCHFEYTSNGSTWSKSRISVSRYGTSCPTGSEYNPTTGECVAPPNACEATNQVTIFHQHKIKNSVSDPDRSEPPGSVCSASCVYTFQYIVHDVYVYVGGEPPGVFGAYEYKGNGFECSEDTHQAPGTSSGQQNPDETPPPDPDNKCPAGYVWNGTFCSPSTPDPTDPDPTDPENPEPGDGGDDGDGDGGGGEGGDGGSGGDGDGDGDGDGGDGGSGGSGGDGDGEGEGEEEGPESSVGGEACSADLSCEGDAVQCAILRKQKEQVCMWQYGSLEKAQVETMLSGPDYQLKEETLPVSGLFVEAVNKGRWLPQSCPAPERFTVMGRQFEMSYDLICRFATALGPLLVVMASIFFAVYVGRAFKG